MQGNSLPAVSLPLGSAWQQQWPRLVLYLSTARPRRCASLKSQRFSEQIISSRGVRFHVPSMLPSGLVDQGWWVSLLASVGLCQSVGGGWQAHVLMTHGHSRIFTWPPRVAALQWPLHCSSSLHALLKYREICLSCWKSCMKPYLGGFSIEDLIGDADCMSLIR